MMVLVLRPGRVSLLSTFGRDGDRLAIASGLLSRQATCSSRGGQRDRQVDPWHRAGAFFIAVVEPAIISNARERCSNVCEWVASQASDPVMARGSIPCAQVARARARVRAR